MIPIELYFMRFATGAGIVLATMLFIRILGIDEWMKRLNK